MVRDLLKVKYMIWQCHLYIEYIAAISLSYNSKLKNKLYHIHVYISLWESLIILFVAKRSSKIGFQNEIHITRWIHIAHLRNTFDAYTCTCILQKLMNLICELWYT